MIPDFKLNNNKPVIKIIQFAGQILNKPWSKQFSYVTKTKLNLNKKCKQESGEISQEVICKC